MPTDLTVHSTAAANKDAVIFHQPPSHADGLLVRHADRIINEFSPNFKVVRDAVDADAFHNSVDLLSPARSFSFLGIKHDPVLDFIEQAAALGVSKDHFQIWQFRFQKQRNTRYSAACASTADESVDKATRLLIDLWSSASIVGAPVGLRFELIGEKSSTWFVGVIRVLFCSCSCEIDELVLIYDGRWTHSFYFCAELE